VHRIKHISLFLLFGFSILLLHSLVPHHHHAEVLSGTVHKECPVEHNDHHDSDNQPWHCHAFNNVDLYNYSSTISQHPSKVMVKLIIPVPELSVEKPPSKREYLYSGINKQYRPVRPPGIISLRAPPGIS